TFQAAPGGHVWMVMSEHYGDDDPRIPITMNFGLPPAVTLAAGAGFDYVVLPKGCDELGVAGAIQGAPVELVEAQTAPGAYSVANAEYVIEGYLDPTDRRWETEEAEESGEQGKHPFHPEWSGYMGRAYRAPTLHVTAVTHRDLATRPLIQPIIVHSAEENNIQTTVREGALYETVDRIEPGIVSDVHIPYALTDWGGAVFQVDKSNPVDEGYHRNFLVAAMSTSRGMRLAIAVDTDIDIYSTDELLWAMTTRVNPDKDMLNPVPGGAGQTFQPSERAEARGEIKQSNTNFEGGLAIDATVPYGELEETFDRPAYAIDQVDLGDWFSEAQLEQARSDRQPGWTELLSKTGM
ncbi:MAG: UbiD family decarboxylase, partial [Salinigranum sp.]